MPDAPGYERIKTVEDVFMDLQGRRAGLIRALTTDLGKMYNLCHPKLENLSLYGHFNGTWEVYVPTADMPPEMPEPVLGINFARDGMPDREWRILVAVHSDIWLLSVAFFHSGRLGFDKAQRKRLFTMINGIPTILEAVSGQAKKQRKAKPKSNPKREPYRKKQKTPPPKPKYEDDDESWEEEGGVEDDEDDDTLCRVEPYRKQPKPPPPMPKYEDDDEGLEEEGGAEDDEDDDTLCGVCEHKYSSDEFWIFCDFCEEWFHGRCVKVTPAQADYIDKYKCPLCCSSKRARP